MSSRQQKEICHRFIHSFGPMRAKKNSKNKSLWSGLSALFELNGVCEKSIVKKDKIQDVWITLMQVQTHSYKEACNRCHKVVSEKGSTVCRASRYPFSTQYLWQKLQSCSHMKLWLRYSISVWLNLHNVMITPTK